MYLHCNGKLTIINFAGNNFNCVTCYVHSPHNWPYQINIITHMFFNISFCITEGSVIGEISELVKPLMWQLYM